MGVILPFPATATQSAVDAAWEDYARLVREVQADRWLALDREHMQEMGRAQRRFFDLFAELDAHG